MTDDSALGPDEQLAMADWFVETRGESRTDTTLVAALAAQMRGLRAERDALTRERDAATREIASLCEAIEAEAEAVQDKGGTYDAEDVAGILRAITFQDPEDTP